MNFFPPFIVVSFSNSLAYSFALPPFQSLLGSLRLYTLFLADVCPRLFSSWLRTRLFFSIFHFFSTHRWSCWSSDRIFGMLGSARSHKDLICWMIVDKKIVSTSNCFERSGKLYLFFCDGNGSWLYYHEWSPWRNQGSDAERSGWIAVQLPSKSCADPEKASTSLVAKNFKPFGGGAPQQ